MNCRFEKVIVIGCGTIANTVLDYVNHLSEEYVFDLECIETERAGLSPQKRLCERYDIKYLYLPERKLLDNYLNDITNNTLVISAGNYYIFPNILIEKTHIEIINFHYALLPKYGGRNAPSWVIYDGEEVTGATWHYVKSEVDGGDIIWQGNTHIEEDMAAWQLINIIMDIAQKGIEEFLPKFLVSEIPGKHQIVDKATFHYSKDIPGNGCFNISDDVHKIYNMLKAFDYGIASPLGELYAVLEDGTSVKILKYKRINENELDKFSFRDNSLILNYKKDYLYIKYKRE